MEYQLKESEKGIDMEIDDTVLFNDQPKVFRSAFNGLKQGGIAEFDNAFALLLASGRLIITIKENEDGYL